MPADTAFFTLAFPFLKLSAPILNSFCSIVIVIGSVISSFEISPGLSITVLSSFAEEILNKPDPRVLVPFTKPKPSFAVRTIWLVASKAAFPFFKTADTFLKLSSSILNSFWRVVIEIWEAVTSSNKILSELFLTVIGSIEIEILNKPDSKVLVPFSKTKPSFAVRTIWLVPSKAAFPFFKTADTFLELLYLDNWVSLYCIQCEEDIVDKKL